MQHCLPCGVLPRAGGKFVPAFSNATGLQPRRLAVVAQAERAERSRRQEIRIEVEDGGRGSRESATVPKHFLPLPKPAHLVYIKPTVAVVADLAPRSSVGVKMTAGNNQLERYVIEFYSRRI